jgi:hypothetical protein
MAVCPEDRFGFTTNDLRAVLEKHKGLIRFGCYVPTRHEVATKDPEWLYSVIIDWWSESPTELAPSYEQVEQVLEVLKSRADAESEKIKDLIAEAPVADSGTIEGAGE